MVMAMPSPKQTNMISPSFVMIAQTKPNQTNPVQITTRSNTNNSLVKIDRPIMRIPMLAIHLQRTLGTDGFKPNPQTHLMPLLATAAKGDAAAAAAAAASGSGDGAAAAENGNGDGDGDGSVAGALHFLCCCVVGAAACVCARARCPPAHRPQPLPEANGKQCTTNRQRNNETTKRNQTTAKHHALLMALVAEQLGVAPSAIVDFELNLCDTQPAALGGAAEEFVFAGRLDNLASCWAAVEVCCCCCLSLLLLSCCVWAGRGVCVWVVRRAAAAACGEREAGRGFDANSAAPAPKSATTHRPRKQPNEPRRSASPWAAPARSPTSPRCAPSRCSTTRRSAPTARRARAARSCATRSRASRARCPRLARAGAVCWGEGAVLRAACLSVGVSRPGRRALSHTRTHAPRRQQQTTTATTTKT